MDGKFDVIPYDDIVILCKNNRKYLIPNIYINPKLLGIGETIRGDIIIVCKNNKNFKSLTKEQCVKYIKFLRRAVLIITISLILHGSLYMRKKFLNGRIIEKDLSLSNYDLSKRYTNDDVLQMILSIQTTILRFIKNNKN